VRALWLLTLWIGIAASCIGALAQPVMTYSAPPPVTVGTTSIPVVVVGAYAHTFTVQLPATSSGNLWLNPAGGAAVPGVGIEVQPGTGFTFGSPQFPLPLATMNGVMDGSSSASVTIVGG
jgi:hypothetical protein